AGLFEQGQRVRPDLRQRRQQPREPQGPRRHLEGAPDRGGFLPPHVRYGGPVMPRARSTRRAGAPAARRGRRPNASPPVPFNRKLVLNQWLLGLFGVERFDQLAAHLKEESLEGLDENNIHRFHHALCLHLPAEQRPELPDALLLEYDQAIVSVTQRLNDRRI